MGIKMEKWQEILNKNWNKHYAELKPRLKEYMPKLLDRIKFGGYMALLRRQMLHTPLEQIKEGYVRMNEIVGKVSDASALMSMLTPEDKAQMEKMGISEEDAIRTLTKSFKSDFFNDIINFIKGVVGDTLKEIEPNVSDKRE